MATTDPIRVPVTKVHTTPISLPCHVVQDPLTSQVGKYGRTIGWMTQGMRRRLQRSRLSSARRNLPACYSGSMN